MQEEIFSGISIWRELQPFETHWAMHNDRGVRGLGTGDDHAI